MIDDIQDPRQMASILRIETRVLGYRRGEVCVDLPTKIRIVRIIRETKPDIAITFDPDFAANTTYGDHIATNQLMMEALGLCYRENFAPEQLAEGLEAWIVKAVYYPFWGLRGRPHVIVDVTDTHDLKTKATLALRRNSEVYGQFIPSLYSKNALEAVLPTYEQVKTDPLKVGEAWQKETRRTTARFVGDQIDVHSEKHSSRLHQ